MSEMAVEDVALWAGVDAVAGTERETQEVATGFAAAAVNVLRNLSFVAANRGMAWQILLATSCDANRHKKRGSYIWKAM